MSQIAQLIKTAAENDKGAYSTYVQNFSSSGIKSLVEGGVDFDTATNFVKQACAENLTLKSLSQNFTVLEKVAAYVESLEAKVEELTKQAEQLSSTIAVAESEPLNKLAQAGFTKEELDQISSLSDTLIEKVANSGSAPMGMGKPVGLAVENTNPLIDFCLS